MPDTDLHLPGRGPLRSVAEAAELAQAVSGLVTADGYRLDGSDRCAAGPRYRPLADRGGPAPAPLLAA